LDQQPIKLGDVRTGLEHGLVFHREALEQLAGFVATRREGRFPEIEVVAQGMSPLNIFPIREDTPSNGVRGP
jgi:hypothetical protein